MPRLGRPLREDWGNSAAPPPRAWKGAAKRTSTPIMARARTPLKVSSTLRPVARAGERLPVPLTLMVITLAVPEELSFFVLGLRLTFGRLILLIMTPILVMKLIRRISSNSYRFVISDLLIVLAGFWMIYAPANLDGIADALNHAGPNALEFCSSYMLTRLSLSKHGQAFSFVDLLCRVISLIALAGLADPLSNKYFIHDLAHQITGYLDKIKDWQDAYRLNLLRASGPIEHPILFGYLCAVGLLFAVSTRIKWRAFVIISCTIGALFSFSSAPLQNIILGLGLLAYNRVMIGVRFRWFVLIMAAAIAVLATFVVSNSPVGFIIAHLIYSPDSGYYREWTWERVSFYVAQSPWFGLGYGEHPEDISHSIDLLWLVLAIFCGVPGAALVALSLISTAMVPNSGVNSGLTHAESKLMTTLGILIFLSLLLAFTVHFWGTSWIVLGLLAGLRAHLAELGQLQKLAVSTGSSISALHRRAAV